MADRRDDVDDWLSKQIEPLPPAPGTFELVKRRAQRRKYRKLAFTATSAALIVAAAVTIPQVVDLPVLSPNPTSSVAAGQSSPVTPSGGGYAESSAAASLPQSTAVGPVPVNFKPTSVTFVGTDTGWVIGQAGIPGQCATGVCTSVARTNDAGRTWTGVPAPRVGAPDGATGVSQVRFLNLDDGWAFGPELFATHDGGKTWTHIATSGLRVTDLETVGDRAFALFANCSGGGPAFAGQCTGFTLYSSPASADDWTPAGPSTTGLTNGRPDEAASLVLTATRGYLLAPDRMLYSGPVDDSAAWPPVARIPCALGQALPDGQPAGALLGAVNATNLVVACTPAPGGRQEKLIFTSANGGVSWQQLAVAPTTGIATSVAASPAETVVLGTTQGIDLLPADEVAWRQATLKGAAPAGGFGYVGMTTDKQGIALPADPASGTVWFTFDGGQSWAPSDVTGS
jgi:photosystem II stability/assembly factor-like uncharacterized protein